ncbi:PHP domain-containing protein [Streptococcus downei]|uniref:Histidinol-phosphatase n=1 Tax=Streptococcus downei MFe28 TaxID=764290 RepID=A0A380JFA0_STRDO|nr:PHP domain-containing protein [Streptococcus downei]EFQ57794.1 histidinol phosphate phosphatase HisJ family [Streptococcus downei F0415]SUN36950.1 Histidinol phosphatase and related hydrolases ofthe PHP family [Streptococcus downei MFe28]
MRDNHLHTYFSYDSQAKFEEYLEAYPGQIVTTEHFDLSNPYTGQDDAPDYQAYSQEIERLNQIYGNRLKRGIEIGYYQPREADILAYLADKEYDLKLLSVHHNGQNDYLDDEIVERRRDEVITEYLDLLEKAIGRVDAHVLAHFDYGFRLFDLEVRDLQVYEQKLMAIFKKMIEEGLAFELNSKSIYLYHHEDLYRYALGLLKELGCHKYSLGSDGHKLEHFRLNFEGLEKILADFNISQEQLI